MSEPDLPHRMNPASVDFFATHITTHIAAAADMLSWLTTCGAVTPDLLTQARELSSRLGDAIALAGEMAGS